MLTNPQYLEVKTGEVHLKYGSLTLYSFWRFFTTNMIDTDHSEFEADEMEGTKAKLLKNLYLLADKYDVKDMLAAVELAQADWNYLEDRLEICKMAQDLGAPRLLDSLVELVVELVPEIESSSVLVSVFEFLLSIDNDSHLLGTLDNLHNIKIKKELVPLTLAEVSKLLDGVEDKIFLVKTIKLAKRWAYNQPAEKTKKVPGGDPLQAESQVCQACEGVSQRQ